MLRIFQKVKLAAEAVSGDEHDGPTADATQVEQSTTHSTLARARAQPIHGWQEQNASTAIKSTTHPRIARAQPIQG